MTKLRPVSCSFLYAAYMSRLVSLFAYAAPLSKPMRILRRCCFVWVWEGHVFGKHAAWLGFSDPCFCFDLLFSIFLSTLFNVVSLLFASAASGACLGKTFVNELLFAETFDPPFTLLKRHHLPVTFFLPIASKLCSAF